MSRVKRVFPDLPFVTASVNTKIIVTDVDNYAFGYSHINTLIKTIDSGGLATDGSNVFVGDQTITGSLNLTGSVYINGHKQYNYGQFYDMTSQSGSSGSIQSMKLNTTDLSEGVSIVSGSQIKVENSGVYNLQFSVQLENTVNTNIVFNIWFAKNGNSIPNSNTHIDVARAQSAQLGKVPAAWNFLSHLNANDYLEIKWTCNDNGGILHMDTGTAQIPGTPSVIATITQVA
jgi:hypothetical protein